MKKSIYLFFLFFFCTNLFGQEFINTDKLVDSLSNLIVHGKTDSIKARANFLLSDHFYRDSVKAKEYLNRGLKLVKGEPILKGLYHHYLAGIYFDLDSKFAIQEYEKAIKEFEKIKSKESYQFQARSWHNIGVLHQYIGEPRKFMDILIQRSIPLSSKANELGNTALYLGEVGMMLMNYKDHQGATQYFKKGLAMMEANPPIDEFDYLEILLNSSRNYLHLNKLDSVNIYLNKAEPVAKNIHNDGLYYDFIEVKSNYFNVNKRFAESEQLLLDGISKALKNNQGNSLSYKLCMLYFQLFKSYLGQNKFQQAKAAMEKSREYDIYKDPVNMILRYSHLAELYEKMNHYSNAYDYLKKAYMLRDSNYSANSKKDMIEMEKRLQLSEKEKEIEKLRSDNEQILLIQKNQRLLNWLFGIGAFIFLLIVLFLYYIYQNNKRTSKIELNVLEQENKLKLAHAVMNAEDNERHRIARDLHDGLGGTLSAIKLRLSAEEKDNNSPGIGESIAQLDGSITDLRNIARNLMPETLIRSGIDVALKDLCASLGSKALQIEYQSYDIGPNIPKDKQLNIYRIVQELLANSIRHGKASYILVQCSQEQNKFLITIEDNGKGFAMKSNDKKLGMGLNNIKKRVELMQGIFDLNSEINEGTTANIELYV